MGNILVLTRANWWMEIANAGLPDKAAEIFRAIIGWHISGHLPCLQVTSFKAAFDELPVTKFSLEGSIFILTFNDADTTIGVTEVTDEDTQD